MMYSLLFLKYLDRSVGTDRSYDPLLGIEKNELAVALKIVFFGVIAMSDFKRHLNNKWYARTGHYKRLIPD